MTGPVADCILDLDADIGGYLTSWQLPGGDGWRPSVTLRQLLAHTAGLSYNWFRDLCFAASCSLAGEGPCRCPQFGQAGVYAGYPAVPGGPVEPRSRKWGGWTVRRRYGFRPIAASMSRTAERTIRSISQSIVVSAGVSSADIG